MIEDKCKLGLEEIENSITKLWKEVLKTENIGVDDNFFELGGNSIKAVALEIMLEDSFDIELSLIAIYKNLTIKQLAQYIEKMERGRIFQVTPAGRMDYYPTTVMQKSYYNLCFYSSIGTDFNIPMAYLLEGNLNLIHFKEIIKDIVNRHDALRTSFVLKGNEPVQVISENIDFEIEYFETKEEINEDFVKKCIKPFDISKAPLFRVILVKYDDRKYVLVIDSHHIVSDGTSLQILINEMQDMYAGKELPKLEINYKDYAVWQNRFLNSDHINQMESYWIGKLSGEIPILDIPYDYPKARDTVQKSDLVHISIPVELVNSLSSMARSFNTTLYTVLFSLYVLLLNKYSGQKDIIVGSISAGRKYSGIEKIIGLFINVLPIRVQLENNMTFAELAGLVGASLTEANDNQEFSLDMIVKKLPNLSEAARGSMNPLYSTMFVFNNYYEGTEEFKLNELNITPYDFTKLDSDMDIQVDIHNNENGALECKWEFNSNLFKKQTVITMAKHFINVAQNIVCDPNKIISDIEILS
jgi:acyl carrier protein